MGKTKTITVQAAGQPPVEVEVVPNSSVEKVRDDANLSRKEKLSVKSATGAGFISDELYKLDV